MTAVPPPPPPPGPPAAAPLAGRPGTVDQQAAFVAVYRLLLRSVATRGRLAAIGALALVSVLTAVLVNASGPDDAVEAATGYLNGNLSTLVPVAVLVFGAATLGDLVDDSTLVYLWLRPVPPRVHVLAAWAATVSIVLPLVGAPLLLATAVISVDGGVIGAVALGTVVAVVAYAAVFVLAGIRFKRALPWGLVYILIWEGFVASAGETAAKLALRSYTRSIVAQLTDQSLKLGDFNLASGILVPLAVAVVALAYASRRLANTDVA